MCGKTFIFTVTEQRKMYESRNRTGEPVSNELVPPANCPSCRLRDPESGRWVGHVKWFSYEKGYGFIIKPDGDEIFFHRSQVVDEPLVSLEDGTAVTFEEAKTDRGAEAKQVKVESHSTSQSVSS
jgi:CspA family cold shock protein